MIEIKSISGEVMAIARPKMSVLQSLVAAFEKEGFKITLSESNGPCAMCMRINSKSRYPKPEFNYRFRSEERRIEYLQEQLESIQKTKQEKAIRSEAKRSARANMVNPFKVGQIMYDSWGYDQTNIDFYQIVGVKPKSVIVRKIGAEGVPGTEGFMSQNVRPVADKFISDEVVKPVMISVGNDGKISYYIKSRHGWISEYDRGEKGVYESWYA